MFSVNSLKLLNHYITEESRNLGKTVFLFINDILTFLSEKYKSNKSLIETAYQLNKLIRLQK